jgi:hypothetical protein
MSGTAESHGARGERDEQPISAEKFGTSRPEIAPAGHTRASTKTVATKPVKSSTTNNARGQCTTPSFRRVVRVAGDHPLRGARHNARVPEVGDYVRVLEGRFADFCGEVRSVDAGSDVALVGVIMFGRETPVEVSIDQIELAQRPVTKSAGAPPDPTDILDYD